jgi:hypothetical protein
VGGFSGPAWPMARDWDKARAMGCRGIVYTRRAGTEMSTKSGRTRPDRAPP